ncbi:MAG: hypothetical protein CRN43_21095 [Candidatus Nephrothrix sp. EaCA]|nr:MAG: hypothetical protein CRN43_21095 [Candidatus Nephrothrix sp. EaCA]
MSSFLYRLLLKIVWFNNDLKRMASIEAYTSCFNCRRSRVISFRFSDYYTFCRSFYIDISLFENNLRRI